MAGEGVLAPHSRQWGVSLAALKCFQEDRSFYG